MVDLKNRAWQILMQWEKLAGFWPYHEKIRKLATTIGFPLILLSCSVTVMIRLRQEWNVNLDIALEDTLLLILHFGLMMRFSICLLDKPRREIFEKVETHIETLVEEDEAAILITYSNKAWTLLIQYTAFLGAVFGLYDTLPAARMFYDNFFGNGTLVKELPFYVDYLVDEQEYFYYILAHLSVVVFTGIIVEFCFELYFFLTVRHACALFEIVKLRLEAASNIFYQCDQNNKLTDSNEQAAFKIISSAVELHIEAIELSASVEEIYRYYFLVSISMTMACIAPLPVVVIIYLHYPFELFRRALVLAFVLAHSYVVFSQGQLIIDHSLSIHQACCDFCWYNSSKRCQTALSIMMMLSLNPRRLTGVFFDLSMETYCNMLKTALSYISMFTALGIKVDH